VSVEPVGDVWRPAAGRSAFYLRIGVALGQALAIWLLLEAAQQHAWPATQPRVFEPLIIVSLLAPLLAIQAASRVPLVALVLWTLAAAAVLAWLGFHDADRGRFLAGPAALRDVLWPAARLDLVLPPALFIAQALAVDSLIERRLAPSYPLHFDTAWGQAVQVILTVAFTLVFWGLLELGAALFALVRIDAFQHLIHHDWFACPATTLAIAVSIHVTDVRPELIRGTRALALTLFSWLAPLFVVIVLGFLASLAVVSLEPLWATHFAAQLLLGAAAQLVFLVNCCYQDGAPSASSRVRRVAASVGAAEIAPVAILAAAAIGLRVGEYGWTAERIFAAAVDLVALCYGAGYAAALLPGRSWLKRLEPTNFAAAYLILALVLALFTPIADPARLMTADQMGRLRSGATPADRFDYAALRREGARWGEAALQGLAAGQPGPAKAGADAALKSPFGFMPAPAPSLSAQDLQGRISVRPAGARLPPAFYAALASSGSAGAGGDFTVSNILRACLYQRCAASYLPLGPGAPPAIAVVANVMGVVFEETAPGQWRPAALLNFCSPAEADDLLAGKAQAQPHPWPDLAVGGRRIELRSLRPDCGS